MAEWRATFSEIASSAEEIIDEARNGRMFVLVDHEERENEGDLVIPAQMATPDAINFMAKHGRGLICLAMTVDRVSRLGLQLMESRNVSRLETAFTVSIEARDGVTTGISAPDRARTIGVAIDPEKGAADIVTPGHIFPLRAREGGVLVRAGHTEAAVDIARLAGLNPSGVICEIMNEDGTMARRDDLIAFAQQHGLKIGTIADLIAYRLRHDRIVERGAEMVLNSAYGGQFRLCVYTNRIHHAEHVALIKGEITPDEPTMVRMHALSVLDDVLGCSDSGKAGELQASMEMIGREGKGVVVLIREAHPTSLSERVAAQAAASRGEASQPSSSLRDYGIGAQILLDLGVREMVLLSNTPKTIIGLEGYGLSVAEQRPIVGPG